MKLSLALVLVITLFSSVIHSGEAEPVIKPKTAKEVKGSGEVVKESAKEAPIVAKGKDKDEEAGGILPLVFVKNKIGTMPTGTKGYIAPDAIKCDSNRRCWVNPDMVYGSSNEGRVVGITKDGEDYSLIIDKEKVEHQWVAQELPATVKWLPVKKILAK